MKVFFSVEITFLCVGDPITSFQINIGNIILQMWEKIEKNHDDEKYELINYRGRSTIIYFKNILYSISLIIKLRYIVETRSLK